MKGKLSLAVAAVVLLGLPAAAAPSEELPLPRGRFLVLFSPAASAGARAALHLRAGALVTGWIPEVGIARVELPLSNAGVYLDSPAVTGFEPERSLKIAGRRPNDPLVNLQWPLRKVGAFDIWGSRKHPDEKVIVSVIDTGIDSGHEDLEGRVLEGFDYIGLDDRPADDHGHGTHVSGVIAANASNRRGIAGLSPGAQILPMKACQSAGACPLLEVYAAVIDSVKQDAQVINMSLGGPGECTTIDQAVFDWAYEQDVVVVAAAGNAAQEDNPTITPANCNHTFAVAATDSRDRRAPFSSYGSFVDIAAPGVDIWSTVPPLISVFGPHIGYGPASGTSMAAPYVSALAALIRAQHPDWSVDQVTQQIIDGARDAGPKGRDDKFGAGIISVPRSVR